MRLAGKTALITGASSGIGREGAILFAREGANVIVADIDDEGAAETLQSIQQAGGTGLAVHMDASEPADNDAAVVAAVEAFGQLDVAWANAGVPAPFGKIDDYSIDVFDKLLAVNAKGPWLLARAVSGELRRTKGSFIITASLSGLKGRPNHSAYQLSKGAAVMLARSLAMEWAPHGVRANGLCPVAADTPMLPQFLESVEVDTMTMEGLASVVPMGRLATATDIANAALFFASDESAFITGINLPVDGGATA